MKINGKNYLLFDRRGCEFNAKFDAEKMNDSDIGNHRITTAERVPLKDGREMFFEFGVFDRYTTRFNNKRTGAKLKKPVRELVMKNAMTLDTEYERPEPQTGIMMSFRDLTIEREFYKTPRKFTAKNILEFVNSLAEEKYDGIIYVHDFEIDVDDENKSYTPAELIQRYAKDHHLECFVNRYFETILQLYTGEYKYMRYEIIKPGRVKITLEKIA